MQAAISVINAAGGIKGHPIDLTVCNDQNNPNVAQSCAEQAVAGHDAAVITGQDEFGTSILPTLQKAGIPFVGNLTETVADATSPVSFPLTSGLYNNASATGIAAELSGCKKAAAILPDYGVLTTSLRTGVQQGLASKGATDVGTIVVPLSTTDYAPSVAAAVQKGASCVIGAMAEAGTTALLTAVKQQGGGLYLVTFGSSMPPLTTIGNLADGTYLAAAGRVPTDPAPGVTLAKQQILAYASGTALTEPGLQAWAAVQLLKDGLLKVTGTYTAANVLAAMNSLTDASTYGLFPPYTSTKPGPIKGQPRVFNPDFIIYKVSGTATQSVGNFQPVAGA